ESLLALLVIPPIAALSFAAFVGIARLLVTGALQPSHWLSRHMGARAARALGVILVVAVGALLVNGVLGNAIASAVNSSFSAVDTGTPDGVSSPASPERSGGPGSLVSWDTLGLQGRVFVARGPNAALISDTMAVPAMNPIRAYAGLASADDAEERARLAVQDLERAGGFQRKNLLVVTSTGTGWVEPSSVSAFEYLAGGDSATVSMQYSFLPSPLSFLADQRHARDAGRALFDAVYGRWRALPADQRPRLYAFGESLGSFGGEAAFSGEYDMANRLDGAVFTGAPNFNPLYRGFVDDRDPGSPEVEPVYRKGRIVRFTTSPGQPIPPVGQPWDGTRVLYMQHASDPITWWSTDLILNRPDWLTEPRGRDVLGATRWVPFVTFWQITIDMPLSMEPGPGHGHNFSGEHVDAWAAVLRTANWNGQKAAQLKEIVRAHADQPYSATPSK
ncbi:MAG: alpha/beta hydrolase, partial [Micrococcales bacterium]|nr:alpha/beta hydrolase [Micrococcales bacterium]